MAKPWEGEGLPCRLKSKYAPRRGLVAARKADVRFPTPFSIIGSVRIPIADLHGLGLRELSVTVVELLKSASASDVTIRDREVTFGRTANPMHSWHILAVIDGGRIEVCSDQYSIKCRYKLVTRSLFFWTFTLSVLATFLIYATSSAFRPAESDYVKTASFLFLVLFGGNYAITAVRFPFWLDAGIRRLLSS